MAFCLELPGASVILGHMAKVPMFISFASEGERIRDLFVGQGRRPDTPWEIVDRSAHESFDERWKTQMCSRIKKCHVVILLLERTTYAAEGAIWELNCGLRGGIPAFGVWISKQSRWPVPSCLRPENIIDGTWEGVRNMIRKAVEMN